jgi:ribosomal protein L11 methyltransferase
MKSSALLQVSLATTLESEEAVMELFGRSFGYPASSYHDLETGEVTVSLYLSEPHKWSPETRRELRHALERIRECGLDVGPGHLKASTVRRKDWAQAWKRHFKPIAIGRRLLVKPSWSKRRALAGQAVVVIDPGLSFGTGQHPTTRFCVEQLARWRRRDTVQSFVDIGTGSGILAIAAAKLGFSPVEAFDVDPDAVRIAEANARRNRVMARMRVWRQDLTRLTVLPARRFDVVCANLIYDILVNERRRIISRVKPAGRLVLAGILRNQFAVVQKAYEGDGLKLVARSADREWESGAFEWRQA